MKNLVGEVASRRFENHIDALNRHMLDHPEDRDFPDQVREIVWSNIYRLFPDYGLSQISETSQRAYQNQHRASIEVGYLKELVSQIEICEMGDFDWRTKPAVFAAYHFASYRLIPPLLIDQGVDLTIVMDRKVAQFKEEAFTGAISSFLEHRKKDINRFRFRDTSDPALVLKLSKDLRGGRSVLFYIDGNTGVDGGRPQEGHSETVPFIDHKVMSRIGIPIVAELGRAPVIPILMQRGTTLTKNYLQVGRAILPTSDRRAFISSSLTEVWKICGEAVRADPGLWESLRYANKYLTFNDAPNGSSCLRDVTLDDFVVFNEKRYAFSDEHAEPVFFDRARAELFQLSANAVPFVKTVSRQIRPGKVADLAIPFYVTQWMIKKEILLYAT